MRQDLRRNKLAIALIAGAGVVLGWLLLNRPGLGWLALAQEVPAPKMPPAQINEWKNIQIAGPVVSRVKQKLLSGSTEITLNGGEGKLACAIINRPPKEASTSRPRQSPTSYSAQIVINDLT